MSLSIAIRSRADLDGLDEVVGRLDLERLDGVLGVRGHEDDRRRTLEVRERLGELHAREPWHVDVEEDDVVGDRADELQRLGGVARLAHDLDAAGLTEQEAQLASRRCLVVDDERLERHAAALRSQERAFNASDHGRALSLDARHREAAVRSEVPLQPIVHVLQGDAKPSPEARVEHARQVAGGDAPAVVGHLEADAMVLPDSRAGRCGAARTAGCRAGSRSR